MPHTHVLFVEVVKVVINSDTNLHSHFLRCIFNINLGY